MTTMRRILLVLLCTPLGGCALAGALRPPDEPEPHSVESLHERHLRLHLEIVQQHLQEHQRLVELASPPPPPPPPPPPDTDR